jgi:dTDP-4-amino-4,6-dideoxygalactose transaminase
MAVPFFSLRDQTRALKKAVMQRVGEVIDTNSFANGPSVARFEEELASYLGIGHVVCVNSGTSALHGALIAAGVQAGDDVITVAHTWISTVWAISYAGARPVFVDIERRTCGLDPRLLDRVVTPRTRAIIPVHLYGHPVDMDPILAFAADRGIAVIEDCAQSIGARYKGRKTGSMGLVNATSFYPSKNLGAYGEGGAVLTNDADIAARVRRLRDHAQAARHHHVELGFNWRMDGLQGAVLSVKLPHLDAWNRRRRAIASRYTAAMKEIPGLTVLPSLGWAEPSWHIYPVFHEQRDKFRTLLEQRGVQTGVHYPTPVHLQPVYSWLNVPRGSLPASEWMAATEVSLPMYPEMSDEQASEVIEAVVGACQELVR